MYKETAKRVVEGLKSAGVDFVSFLPESRLNDIIPLLEAEESITVVRASNEASATLMATGAALVGRKAAVYTESSGLYLSMYALVSTTIRCQIPILYLVAHTGTPGDKVNSATFTQYGQRLEAVLDAMRIQYTVLEEDSRVEQRIDDMVRAARSAQQPAALLFTGDFTAFEGEWT